MYARCLGCQKSPAGCYSRTRNQLPEGASPPRAACLRVYPLAVSEGVVFVWMGADPWGEGAKDILPVPSTADKLDENKVRVSYGGRGAIRLSFIFVLPRRLEQGQSVQHRTTCGCVVHMFWICRGAPG